MSGAAKVGAEGELAVDLRLDSGAAGTVRGVECPLGWPGLRPSGSRNGGKSKLWRAERDRGRRAAEGDRGRRGWFRPPRTTRIAGSRHRELGRSQRPGRTVEAGEPPNGLMPRRSCRELGWSQGAWEPGKEPEAVMGPCMASRRGSSSVDVEPGAVGTRGREGMTRAGDARGRPGRLKPPRAEAGQNGMRPGTSAKPGRSPRPPRERTRPGKTGAVVIRRGRERHHGDIDGTINWDGVGSEALPMWS